MRETIYIIHNGKTGDIDGAYRSLREAYLACINYYNEEEDPDDWERIVKGINFGYRCVSMHSLWIYQTKLND